MNLVLNRGPDSIDCCEAVDEAGTEIPGLIEFATFAEGEYIESIRMPDAKARELWERLGKLLFQPDLEEVDIASIHEKARELHCVDSDDDIELDDVEKYTNNEPLAHRISIADEGFWVQGWLWVPAPDDDEEDDTVAALEKAGAT
jgi:hypothetical protein